MTIRTTSALAAAFLFTSALAVAQEKKLDCKGGGERQNRVCEMRESSVALTGKLDVDAAPNGGITVNAWEKNEILVRARVEAWGDSEAEAKQRLGEVKVLTDGGKVKSDGPRSQPGGKWGQQKWSVSYEIFTPTKIDLGLRSVNGGLHINNVSGNLKFETVNGGVTLAGVNGTVKGETVNGGVNVDIAGSRWEGTGLEVGTVNGGVTISVPASFAANVSASTVNGGLSADFEGAVVEGKWGPKKVEFKAGGGGAPVKVSTVNGGVRIKKKG
ncbi:MAG: hypothetical protein HZB13_20410 [Acidobacteria bacterium]|nr:hypothetical protein [Acidobacteriota bacterium]